jgi:hypothetical protein
MVFQMDRCTIAGLEDLPDHLEPGLQVETPAHENVVNVGVGERRPHIVDPGAGEELDIRNLQLLTHVAKNRCLYTEKQYPLGHAYSPPYWRVLTMLSH